MKIKTIEIHNFRSISDVKIETSDFTLLVGANNAGKSNVINALLTFYDKLKWSESDFPKFSTLDMESWIELSFKLSDEEWDSLEESYKNNNAIKMLTVRRYFKSNDKDRVKSNQSNIYGVVNEEISAKLFYGAKNVSTSKMGEIIYIPAISTPADQMKTSGASPFRDALNILIKKFISTSKTYGQISKAYEEFNLEAKTDSGFLSAISNPLNTAFQQWGVKLDLSVSAIKPEEITKSLITASFSDLSLDSGSCFDIDRYGHGFQRTVVYEIIKLLPATTEVKIAKKEIFDPAFSLILFEEPEAFLHPGQQEIMVSNLRNLAKNENHQVMISTHSTTFTGKNIDDMKQIVRLQRNEGKTVGYQLTQACLDSLLSGGTVYSTTTTVENEKAKEEEQFRYQGWLDTSKSSIFFADKILIVEGATERILFNYLLSNEWSDLLGHRIFVLDSLGKYNVHRYINLCEAYGIWYGVIIDKDSSQNQNNCNSVIDALIKKGRYKLSDASHQFNTCLETFLGICLIKRADKKPIEVLKAIENGEITEQKLLELKGIFCAVLNLSEQGAVDF